VGVQQHALGFDAVEQRPVQTPRDTLSAPRSAHGEFHEPEGAVPVLAPHVVGHGLGQFVPPPRVRPERVAVRHTDRLAVPGTRQGGAKGAVARLLGEAAEGGGDVVLGLVVRRLGERFGVDQPERVLGPHRGRPVQALCRDDGPLLPHVVPLRTVPQMRSPRTMVPEVSSWSA
jgi:hypothetical protein